MHDLNLDEPAIAEAIMSALSEILGRDGGPPVDLRWGRGKPHKISLDRTPTGLELSESVTTEEGEKAREIDRQAASECSGPLILVGPDSCFDGDDSVLPYTGVWPTGALIEWYGHCRFHAFDIGQQQMEKLTARLLQALRDPRLGHLIAKSCLTRSSAARYVWVDPCHITRGLVLRGALLGGRLNWARELNLPDLVIAPDPCPRKSTTPPIGDWDLEAWRWDDRLDAAISVAASSTGLMADESPTPPFWLERHLANECLWEDRELAGCSPLWWGRMHFTLQDNDLPTLEGNLRELQASFDGRFAADAEAALAEPDLRVVFRETSASKPRRNVPRWSVDKDGLHWVSWGKLVCLCRGVGAG